MRLLLRLRAIAIAVSVKKEIVADAAKVFVVAKQIVLAPHIDEEGNVVRCAGDAGVALKSTATNRLICVPEAG